MNIYQAPELGGNTTELDFDAADLARLLRRQDPRRLPKPRGINRQRFAALPGREDVFLRWAIPAEPSFPLFGDQVSLETHLDTYQARLARLAAGNVIQIPTHRSFALLRCPQQRQSVIYTVVERVPVQSLESSRNYELIRLAGHALVDDVEKGPPFADDHAWLKQYGITDKGGATLLDLDPYTTMRTIRPLHALHAWGRAVEHYDDGVLYDRIADAYDAARDRQAA